MVKWVAESLRPFSIVRDPAFRELMLTGRPFIELPSPTTVGRDVRKVFKQVRGQVAQLLQVS